MRKLFLLSLMLVFVTFSYASTKAYYINDDAVEETLNNAIQVDFVSAGVSDQLQTMNMTSIQAADPDPWVAFILDFFLGGLGIHRVYLGGKTSLVLIYFITCGGIFGIVPLIDLVVLAIGAANNDISQFVNNDAFFMWK